MRKDLKLFVTLIALTASAVFAAEQPSVPGLTRKISGKVAQITKLRDAAIAEIPKANLSQKHTGVMRITLPKVADGANMTLNIAFRNGKHTVAWATGFLKHCSRVEIRTATFKDRVLKADVRVHVVPYWFYRGEDSSNGAGGHGPYATPFINADGRLTTMIGLPLPMDLSVEAKFSSKTAKSGKGTASVRDPECGPYRSGPFGVKCDWLVADRPRCARFMAGPASAGPVGIAGAFESEAMYVYEQIRAIDLQLRTGIPYPLAEGFVTRFRTSRDDPQLGAKKPAKKAVKKVTAPSLDEEDDDLLLGDGGFMSDGDQAQSNKEKKLLDQKVIAKLEHINTRLALVHQKVLAWRKDAAVTAAPYQSGDIVTDDPEFGPWSRADALPTDKDLVNILPNTFDRNAPQVWPYIDKWRVTGPVTVMTLPTHCTGLPDVFADPDTFLLVQTNSFEWSRYIKYHGTGRTPWVLQATDPRNGWVEAPRFSTYGQRCAGNMMPWGGLFAFASVKSPRDVTTWASLSFPSRGAVWVNDELVWSSDYNEDLNNWFIPHRFKMPLKKGMNRVTVRSEIYGQYYGLGFGMRICVQGKPRSAEQVAADNAARDKAYATLKPPCGMMGGGDMSSARLFPDANPPIAWNIEKNVNVLWRTKLPWSRGGIIAVKDRLFTTWDPFHLVCLNKADGKILWMRHLDPVKVKHPEIWAKEKAYLDKFDAMDIKGELDGDELKARKALEKEREEFLKKHKATSEGIKRKHGRGSGITFANPVSDGRLVYLKVPSGRDVTVGCFDLDGNEKWMKVLENAKGGYGGLVPSPVLVGNKLIMMRARYLKGTEEIKAACGGNEAPKGAEWARPQRYALTALDTATGEVLWESPAYPYKTWKFDAGAIAAPIVVRLTNGKDTMDVVLQSAGGAVIRVDDGKELMDYCGALAWKITPVNNNRGSVWFTGRRMARVDFSMADRDNVYGRLVWNRERLCEGKGPIQTRDMLFLGDRVSMLESYWKTWDAETGINPGRHTQEFFPMGTEPLYYMPSIRAGGKVVYLGTTKETGWAPNGSMVSVLAEKQPVILARNWHEGHSSQPICENDKMYSRCSAEVMCLGYTGDEGRRYEAEEIVKTLMSQVPPEPPQNGMDTVQLPDRLEALSSEAGMFRRQVPDIMRNGLPIHTLKITEPLPPAEAGWVQEFLLKLTTEPRKHSYKYGNAGIVKEGKKRVPEEGLDYKMLATVIAGVGAAPERFMDPLEQYGIHYRLKRAHKGQAGTVCFWHAPVNFDREMTARLSLGRSRNTRAWIDGVEVKDGQLVRGSLGKHYVLIRTEVANDEELADSIRPVFHYAPSPDYERTYRQRLLDGIKPVLAERTRYLQAPELKQWATSVLR